MKNKLKRNVLLICGVAAAALLACQKDPVSIGAISSQSSIVTFTINGDGYSNENITIKGLKTVPENEGEYFTQHGFTNIQVGDNATETTLSKNSLHGAFDGRQQGMQAFGAQFANTTGTQVEVNFVLTLTSSMGTKTVYDSDTNDFGYKPSGTVNITHYNAVNGTIEGTFTGMMANQETGEFITIANGTFVVPRHKDIPL